MESSPDRENSQGTTESRVADDKVHKHGTQEVSSAEYAAAAASSVSESLGRVSGSERHEGLLTQKVSLFDKAPKSKTHWFKLPEIRVNV